MKVTAAELAYVRSRGLYVTEKCDGCGKLLNQTIRYTISGRPEPYCSAPCRDLVFFGDRYQAKKYSSAGKCAYCGSSLEGKKRDALYCGGACRKRAARSAKAMLAAGPEKSRTPGQSNQQLAEAEMHG